MRSERIISFFFFFFFFLFFFFFSARGGAAIRPSKSAMLLFWPSLDGFLGGRSQSASPPLSQKQRSGRGFHQVKARFYHRKTRYAHDATTNPLPGTLRFAVGAKQDVA